MIPCPNCQHPNVPETRVCPNCGEALPPTPVLGGVTVRQTGRRPPLRGAKDWLLAILGFVIALLSPLVFGVGFLGLSVVYIFGKERRDEPFLRGVGWGLLTVVVLLLGAFAICLYLVVGPH